jgi:hypothetical protein
MDISPGLHTYLSIQFGRVGAVIEGGPTGSALLSSLMGYDAETGPMPASNSDPGGVNNVELGSGFGGAMACAVIQGLEGAVDNYDAGSLAVYNFQARYIGGIGQTYNSNSFTYTLASQFNLLQYFSNPQIPGLLLYGWRLQVPGL